MKYKTQPATPEPLLQQYLPEEHQGKTKASCFYRVLPYRGGPDLGPSYHPHMIECNLRIDFANDGSIYNVAWSNTVLQPLPGREDAKSKREKND